MPERLLVIPAAGRGSRLATAVPKPLVSVAGKPMIDYLLDLYAGWTTGTVIIVNRESGAAIRDHCAKRAESITFAVQPSPTGMLDAILLAAPAVRRSDAQQVWITWCDQVAVRPETVAGLAAASANEDVALALPVLVRRHAYTHLERDNNGRITNIRSRREGDQMPELAETEMGLFALSRDAYLEELPRFSSEVATSLGAGTGERNFLPFIPWLASRRPVVTFLATEDIEAVGVNTPEELVGVEAVLKARQRW